METAQNDKRVRLPSAALIADRFVLAPRFSTGTPSTHRHRPHVSSRTFLYAFSFSCTTRPVGHTGRLEIISHRQITAVSVAKVETILGVRAFHSSSLPCSSALIAAIRPTTTTPTFVCGAHRTRTRRGHRVTINAFGGVVLCINTARDDRGLVAVVYGRRAITHVRRRLADGFPPPPPPPTSPSSLSTVRGDASSSSFSDCENNRNDNNVNNNHLANDQNGIDGILEGVSTACRAREIRDIYSDEYYILIASPASFLKHFLFFLTERICDLMTDG